MSLSTDQGPLPSSFVSEVVVSEKEGPNGFTGNARMDRMFAGYVKRNPVPSAVVSVQSFDGTFSWTGCHGRRSTLDASSIGPDDPYFIASATKLFVTAMIMQVGSQGLLEPHTPIVDLLPAGAIDGMHVGSAGDRTGAVTVGHLLSHTSGLANYLEDRQRDRSVLLADVMKPGRDRSWTRDDIVNLHRTQFTPKFAPARNRAHYSDTNFQLLGMVLETVTGCTFADNLRRRIIEPLGLSSTAMFGAPGSLGYDDLPAIHAGRSPLHIPLTMSSVREDGGMYSSTADSMVFLRAFFGGSLFPAAWLDEMADNWNRIFFPFQYGVGLMRFALPRFMAPFGSPVFLGHGGASGCLMFFEPTMRLLIAGTVNQIQKRSRPYQLMMKLAQAVG